MVRALEWKDFVVLYEESEGLVRLQEVLKMASHQKEIRVTVRQLIPDEEGDYR